jgi:hypothetical protein
VALKDCFCSEDWLKIGLAKKALSPISFRTIYTRAAKSAAVFGKSSNL